MISTMLREQDERDIIEHLKLREGVRNKVYKDSLGKLTVGVGHLVLPKDNLKLGDVISDERVNAFLREDARTAIVAAESQAFMLVYLRKNREIREMIKALASVNFQLGPNWYFTHKATWRLLKEGKLLAAAEEIKDSLWYAQTPVRVNDFSKALVSIDKMLRENTNDTTKSTTG